MREIADLVLKPKIDQVLQEHGGEIKRKKDITLLFNKAYGSAVSDFTMARWLELAGYKMGHRFLIGRPVEKGLETPPKPSAPQPIPSMGRPRVQPQHGGLTR